MPRPKSLKKYVDIISDPKKSMKQRENALAKLESAVNADLKKGEKKFEASLQNFDKQWQKFEEKQKSLDDFFDGIDPVDDTVIDSVMKEMEERINQDKLKRLNDLPKVPTHNPTEPKPRNLQSPKPTQQSYSKQDKPAEKAKTAKETNDEQEWSDLVDASYDDQSPPPRLNFADQYDETIDSLDEAEEQIVDLKAKLKDLEAGLPTEDNEVDEGLEAEFDALIAKKVPAEQDERSKINKLLAKGNDRVSQAETLVADVKRARDEPRTQASQSQQNENTSSEKLGVISKLIKEIKGVINDIASCIGKLFGFKSKNELTPIPDNPQSSTANYKQAVRTLKEAATSAEDQPDPDDRSENNNTL